MKAFLFTTTFLMLLVIKPCSAQEIDEEANEPMNTTTIQFESTSFDFGEIQEGELVKHVFKFTNIGDKPLIITNAQGSCGCTVPFYPKVPIMPGESSEVEIVFNSSGRVGAQMKQATISANTSPNISVLKIRGTVIPSEKTEEEIQAEFKKRQEEKAAIEELNPNCFAIFPNPTSDELQLDLKDYIGREANVHITNKLGQTLLKKSIPKISAETTLFDVSTYTPGIYLISIEIKGQKPMTQCFVVTGG